MPEVKEGESKQEWLDRCIPQVMDEGTAEDQKQAVAICHSMYRRNQQTKTGRKKLKSK